MAYSQARIGILMLVNERHQKQGSQAPNSDARGFSNSRTDASNTACGEICFLAWPHARSNEVRKVCCPCRIGEYSQAG